MSHPTDIAQGERMGEQQVQHLAWREERPMRANLNSQIFPSGQSVTRMKTQQKWAEMFWQNVFHWKNADLSKWNVPREHVDSRRSKADSKPVCFSASSPTNLPSKKLSVLVKMPPDTGVCPQKISKQIADERRARSSRNPEWKRAHLGRAARSVFWDTEPCSWEHQDILLNFISTYICQAILFFFFFFKIIFPSTVTFFTEVKFCFLASSSSRSDGAPDNFRACSMCYFESSVNFLLKHLSPRGQNHLAQSNGELCRILRSER